MSKHKDKKKQLLNIKIKDKFIKIENNNINIYNILSSLALLKELNLNLNNITNLFKKYEPTEGRGKNIKRYNKKFKLIDESC